MGTGTARPVTKEICNERREWNLNSKTIINPLTSEGGGMREPKIIDLDFVRMGKIYSNMEMDDTNDLYLKSFPFSQLPTEPEL